IPDPAVRRDDPDVLPSRRGGRGPRVRPRRRVTEHRGGDRVRVTARRVCDATPRRSSRSSLAFTLDTGAPAVSGSRLATLVTAHIARAFGGDRGRATAEAVTRVSRTLGATGWRRWSPPERRAFERLA